MKLRWSKRNRLLAIAASALAIFMVVAMTVGWSGTEVCRRCGRELHYAEWRLGLDGPVVHRVSRNETETPFSKALTPLLESQPCLNEWCFATGGNYTVVFFSKSCAIGHGRHLLQAIRSTNVAAFLQQLGKSAETNSLWRWRDRLLDPEHSRTAAMAVANAEDDRDEGQTWPMAAEAFFREMRGLQPAERR
jgi:hypothetical protein